LTDGWIAIFLLALKRFTHIPYIPISLSTFIELTDKNEEVESDKSYIPTSLGTVVRTNPLVSFDMHLALLYVLGDIEFILHFIYDILKMHHSAFCI
jgi:hypothetical protein